jgi:hypothetical protein
MINADTFHCNGILIEAQAYITTQKHTALAPGHNRNAVGKGAEKFQAGFDVER